MKKHFSILSALFVAHVLRPGMGVNVVAVSVQVAGGERLVLDVHEA